MHTTQSSVPAGPVEAARVAIWRLFEEGYVDEDMATASLLAVDLGMRRRPAGGAPRRAATEPTSRPHRPRAA